MTAQTELALDRLALSRGAWLINRIDLNYAARTLEISATWDEDRAFRLIFMNFYLESWQVFSDAYDPGVMNADVIGMDFDEQAPRKSAVLHTDMFELIVSYSQLEIEKA